MASSARARLQTSPDAVRAKCVEMRDFVVRIRAHTAMQFAAPVVQGLPARIAAAAELEAAGVRLAPPRQRSQRSAQRHRSAARSCPKFPSIPAFTRKRRRAGPRFRQRLARATPIWSFRPPSARRYEAAFARFASVFPDTFYVTERGRYFPDDSADKGRLLSAGYHSVMGYFRDDTPLMELILDEKGQKELDRLWNEFDFIADFTARTWIQYYFNQSGEVQGKGAESGTPRPADHQITDAPKSSSAMRDAYLAKAAADPKNDPVAPEAIRDHFERINATLRNLEKERDGCGAEASGRAASIRRARLPPAADQSRARRHAGLLPRAADKNDLSHEDAIRDSIVSVLMSPDFLYRLDLSDDQRDFFETASSVRRRCKPRLRRQCNHCPATPWPAG